MRYTVTDEYGGVWQMEVGDNSSDPVRVRLYPEYYDREDAGWQVMPIQSASAAHDPRKLAELVEEHLAGLEGEEPAAIVSVAP